MGSQSLGVRKGVYRCALRGLIAAAQDTQTRAALQRAQGANAVQVTSHFACFHILYLYCGNAIKLEEHKLAPNA